MGSSALFLALTTSVSAMKQRPAAMHCFGYHGGCRGRALGKNQVWLPHPAKRQAVINFGGEKAVKAALAKFDCYWLEKVCEKFEIPKIMTDKENVTEVPW